MFAIGQKVVAVKKSVGIRNIDNCASFYRRVEMEQDFLFVNAVDEKASAENNETCYWCDAVRGMGDLYKESDLMPYQEQ